MSQVADRLLQAACELFLEQDFHRVSIRSIAERAGTSSGMIKYYFNNKQGLFEAMIRQEYGRILDILHDIIEQKGLLNFTEVIDRVLSVYERHPNIPKFIIKTYLLRRGPGSQFLESTFEYERHIVQSWVDRVIHEGKIDANTNAEVVRIAFMSLTLLPGMMQPVFHDSYGEQGYQHFRQQYAHFSGDMLLAAVKPKPSA